jgi:hypothetical protein
MPAVKSPVEGQLSTKTTLGIHTGLTRILQVIKAVRPITTLHVFFTAARYRSAGQWCMLAPGGSTDNQHRLM